MIQLQPQCLEGLDTLPGLQQALQNAIELEHATLPTYLYAMYSLDQSENSEIYGLIRSVVMEEMSHFGLACNILNAIGGSPAIDTPEFVPSYPGPLPCGVEDQLTVPLAPFSIDLVKNVFMVIEEPEDPVAVEEAAIPEAPLPESADVVQAEPEIEQTGSVNAESPESQESPHAALVSVPDVETTIAVEAPEAE